MTIKSQREEAAACKLLSTQAAPAQHGHVWWFQKVDHLMHDGQTAAQLSQGLSKLHPSKQTSGVSSLPGLAGQVASILPSWMSWKSISSKASVLQTDLHGCPQTAAVQLEAVAEAVEA